MKRVFISFRAEDKNQVNGLRLLAANPKFEIEFYDESVRQEIKSQNNEYIKRKIREKISRTSVTVCLVSEYTHTSEWVCWELEESIAKNNGIICMGLPNGPDRLVLPAPLKKEGIGWLLWDYNELARLIG